MAGNFGREKERFVCWVSDNSVCGGVSFVRERERKGRGLGGVGWLSRAILREREREKESESVICI